MKRLHNCVNIVPVIAKADTLTIEERDAFKQRVSPCHFVWTVFTLILFFSQIREDIRHYGINIYPAAYGAEDEEDAAANSKIQVCGSFSVFYVHFLYALSPPASFYSNTSLLLWLVVTVKWLLVVRRF